MPKPPIPIYTACFGDHDQPAEVPEIPYGTPYCFTDSEALGASLKTWSVFGRRRRFLQPRMDAKWYKMSACHLMPQAGMSIYIDSSVRIRQPEIFVEYCLEALGDNEIAFYSHPEGQRSIAEEAAFSMSMGKYAGEPCERQAAHYGDTGFPAHERELLSGGVIVRRHTPDIARFEKAWFDECMHWSVQDQVSLPFVLWREQIDYSVIAGNIYDNEVLMRVWSGPNR